jgi:hypothetical protein
MLVIPRLIEAVIRSIFVPSASSVFFKVAAASRRWCSASEQRRDASTTISDKERSPEGAATISDQERRRDASTTFNSLNRFQRKETERFKCFAYDDLVKRDKVNLDIFWLKDESLEDSANLPAPDVIAAEIVEDLEAALANSPRSRRILANPANQRKGCFIRRKAHQAHVRSRPSCDFRYLESKNPFPCPWWFMAELQLGGAIAPGQARDGNKSSLFPFFFGTPIELDAIGGRKNRIGI